MAANAGMMSFAASPPLLAALGPLLTLRSSTALSMSCPGFPVVGITLKAMADADYATQLAGNQNIEVTDEGVVLNTLCYPYSSFARTACVSIQFAWAQRCLATPARAVASIVGPLLEGKLGMTCITKGGGFHDRILRDIMGVGADGLRQDTANQWVARTKS